MKGRVMAGKGTRDRDVEHRANIEDIITITLPIHTGHCLFIIIEFIMRYWSSIGSCG
jgi:hypothetical protein